MTNDGGASSMHDCQVQYMPINEPNKKILDLQILDQTPIIYDLKKTINGSRHLIPPLARTKASLICLF